MNISDQEVHLWFILNEEIQEPEVLLRLGSLLNAAEATQQKRYRNPSLQHRYVVTHGVLRSLLSAYEPRTSPQDWKFLYNQYGKPYLNTEPHQVLLRFNISHTDKVNVIVFGLIDEIGVDVEHVERELNYDAMVNNLFSYQDIAELSGLEGENRKKRFFDIWTLKEAYIKACGMGLSIPLDRFYFSFSDPDRISIGFDQGCDERPEAWQFWQVQPTESHIAAVALKSHHPKQLTVRKLDANVLNSLFSSRMKMEQRAYSSGPKQSE